MDYLSGPAGRPASPALVPLAYADDDAAAVSSLIGEVAASLHLLTVMDAATQSLYHELVAAARPPSLAAVEQGVTAIAAEIERDRTRGDQSVVRLFFSGHGSASYRGEPALALSDGALNRDQLYERVLARLPATYVHLLVDASKALLWRPHGPYVFRSALGSPTRRPTSSARATAGASLWLGARVTARRSRSKPPKAATVRSVSGVRWGKLGWFWQAGPSRFRIYAGPRAVAGIVVQRVEGEPTLSSAVGAFGAAAGVAGRVIHQLGMFAEFEVAAHLLDKDGVTGFSSAPSVWVGASWEM